MPKVFISYRRDDSEFAVDRIYQELASRFGAGSVFMDVSNIPKGVDFRAYLRNAVSQCDILIAVIGKHWLNSRDEDGRRRLDDPSDFVRIEISSALDRKIPVIPVLLGGISVPRLDELPEDLKELVYRNASELSRVGFEEDLNQLVRDLEHVAKKRPSSTPKQSSSIRFVCQSCGGTLNVPKKSAGRKLHCPKCGLAGRVNDLTAKPKKQAESRPKPNKQLFRLFLCLVLAAGLWVWLTNPALVEDLIKRAVVLLVPTSSAPRFSEPASAWWEDEFKVNSGSFTEPAGSVKAVRCFDGSSHSYYVLFPAMASDPKQGYCVLVNGELARVATYESQPDSPGDLDDESTHSIRMTWREKSVQVLFVKLDSNSDSKSLTFAISGGSALQETKKTPELDRAGFLIDDVPDVIRDAAQTAIRSHGSAFDEVFLELKPDPQEEETETQGEQRDTPASA